MSNLAEQRSDGGSNDPLSQLLDELSRKLQLVSDHLKDVNNQNLGHVDLEKLILVVADFNGSCRELNRFTDEIQRLRVMTEKTVAQADQLSNQAEATRKDTMKLAKMAHHVWKTGVPTKLVYLVTTIMGIVIIVLALVFADVVVNSYGNNSIFLRALSTITEALPWRQSK